MSLSDKESSSPTSDESSSAKRIQVDGGLQAWSIILGGFLVTMTTFGYSYAFGVFQDVYTRSELASTSRISWIGSTQQALTFIVGLPAGKMLDLGYYRHTMALGTIVYVFSMFMVSIAHHDQYYQIFLSQGVGMGVGAGMLYVPAMAIQAHYWQRKRAVAMGIAALGSSVGGIIYPIMLNQFFKDSVGFAWGMRASAFLTLGLLMISYTLMKPNPDILLLEKPKPDVKGIMKDVPYLFTILGGFLIQFGLFFPYYYIQLFTILKGMDQDFAFYTLAIMNAASIPGRLVPNYLADKIGSINTIIPVGAVCSILLFVMVRVSTIGAVVAFSILYGFASGAWISLASPLVATLARHESEIGIRFGIMFALTGVGALIGAPIDGTLLKNTFPWWKPSVLSGVSVICGTGALVITRHMLAKRRGTQLV